MTKKQKNRLSFLILIFLMFFGITLIILSAYKNNISFFMTPSQIKNTQKHITNTLRLGGRVKPHTLRDGDNQHSFIVFDEEAEIKVQTKAPLPPLFKDNQGVVIEGRLAKDDDIFYGSKILAKHDEKYMPKACTEKE
jgi:cytochrome c-type biogenesis protein CcmE